MSLIRMTRLRAAAAAALLSLTLAAPAFAGHDDGDDETGSGRGYPVYQHDRHCDRDDRGGRGGYYGGWGDHRGRGTWDRSYRRHEEYGCRPCGRRWRDEDGFYRHLTRHHGVPYRAIPRMLVYVDWGWLFRG